jgi:ABC-type Co2+ transport system permease subunit
MYGEDSNTVFDIREIVKRAFKYFVEGAMVAIAAFYIPRKKMDWEEILMIALTAAATFALLDMYAPSIGLTARQGAGFGIGANMVGFPGNQMTM